jgi:hypothetical protein
MHEKTPEWTTLSPPQLLEPKIVAAIHGLMATAGDRLIQHDPIWLSGDGRADRRTDDARILVYQLRRNECLIGFSPFLRTIRDWRFAIGELTLFRFRVPSLSLMHGPIFSPDLEQFESILSLFHMIANDAGKEKTIFLEGVPLDSKLFSTLKYLDPKTWIAIPLSDPYEHSFADLPASFEQYETQLSKRSRQSLRYSKKQAVRDFNGAVEIRRFTMSKDIPEFIAHAQSISQKTYQWHLLGLGLRDAEALAGRLNLAANNGWLRCYILFCRGQPVAFMLGYLYSGVYHYVDVGYDPAFAKWSVGSILHMEVMRDLLATKGDANRFDFSTGSGAHKARFGNTSRTEINYLVLPRHWRNLWAARFYTATRAADKWLSTVAGRLGMKARIKKFFRRMSSRQS